MFTLLDGAIEKRKEFQDDQVPQKVKHGDNIWDSQDKIFRHIENHLHRHLQLVGKRTASFVQENSIAHIIIGSHKPLFKKIEKHLPYPLAQKVAGKFVTELKVPFNEIVRRAQLQISLLETQ